MTVVSQARSTHAIRERIVQDVPAAKDFLIEGIHHDAHEWVVTSREAIGNLLPPGSGEKWLQLTSIGILEENRCCRPDCQFVTRTTDMRSCLSLSVVNPVTSQPFTTVMEAINYYMRDEETELICGSNCGSNRSIQHKSLSILPKVKSLLI